MADQEPTYYDDKGEPTNVAYLAANHACMELARLQHERDNLAVALQAERIASARLLAEAKEAVRERDEARDELRVARRCLAVEYQCGVLPVAATLAGPWHLQLTYLSPESVCAAFPPGDGAAMEHLGKFPTADAALLAAWDALHTAGLVTEE